MIIALITGSSPPRKLGEAIGFPGDLVKTASSVAADSVVGVRRASREKVRRRGGRRDGKPVFLLQ